MTYEARETSASAGRPVEIYTFARDYQRWRYTSADRELIVDSQTFLPRAITRSAIEVSGERVRSAMRITAPRDLEVADLYRIAPPSIAVTLILQQYHEGDGEVATLWTGRVTAVDFRGPAAEITCEPTYTAMRRVGLRRLFQRQCPHVLFGSGCGVNRSVFMDSGTVDSISGAVVNVAAASLKPDGYYAGGYVEWDAAVGIAERRFITDHAGGALTLSVAPYGLAGSAPVRLFPGCDHTLTTCDAKFDNAARYGGFPFIPKKNPFGGEPVF